MGKTQQIQKKLKTFKKIQSLFIELNDKNHGLEDISIGMSGDYIEALKCGSTMIRIGTNLYGQR